MGDGEALGRGGREGGRLKGQGLGGGVLKCLTVGVGWRGWRIL